MSENKLTAVSRSDRGKNAMRRLRKNGMVPAVFYGANYETMAITVKLKELEASIALRKGLVNLEIEGSGNYEVVFREVQRDPMTDAIKHIDLLGITRGQMMTAKVQVILTGTPIGVKTSGGILEFNKRYLEIECLPKDLPENITLDVSGLDIGDSIHVEDLNLEEITILDSSKSTIALVAAPVVAKTTAAGIEEAEGEEGEESDEKSEENSEDKK